MIRPAIALAITLAALAPPSEAAASGGEPVQKTGPAVSPDDPGAQPVPPGSAADVALWRAGNAATETITVERSRASVLATRLRANQVVERLGLAAEKAGPAEKEALLSLQARLLAAWQASYQQLSRQWPVDPTRGCGYATLAFDSQLRAAPGTDRGELAQARGALSECVAKAEGAVKALVETTVAFEAVAAEADKALRPPAKEPAGKGKE